MKSCYSTKRKNERRKRKRRKRRKRRKKSCGSRTTMTTRTSWNSTMKNCCCSMTIEMSSTMSLMRMMKNWRSTRMMTKKHSMKRRSWKS
jgi:hypothetical protein